MKAHFTRAGRAVAVLGAGALALALAGPATGSVQTGSSGWQWGNPLPQGNTINAMSFSGVNGFAVGNFGTVLSTADGGSTWTGRRSGTSADLTEVQAVNDTTFFAGGGCVGRLSSDSGASFTRVAFTSVESTCTQTLAAAWFVSATTGFLTLSDGTMMTTPDGGVSFSRKTAVPGTTAGGGSATPTDLLFFSATEGLATTNDGHVYRTTDGAQTWASVAAFGRGVTSLITGPTLIPGGLSIYALGAGGLIRESIDGGVTWSATERFAVPGGVTLTGGACPTAILCEFTTLTGANEPSQVLVRWLQGVAPPADVSEIIPSGSAIKALAFASVLRAVAAGVNGTTALSDNAGVTFTAVGSAIPGNYRGIVAGPGSTAFAFGENGALATSSDGGVTWTARNVPTSSIVIDVTFTSALVGYALDDVGGLFRTSDGGVTWRNLDLGTTTPPDEILATDDNTLFVAGPVKARVSTDAGETFEDITALKKKKTGGVFQLDFAGGALFARGNSTAWVSNDDGDTWKQVMVPPKGSGCQFQDKCSGVASAKNSLGQIDFVTPKQGWAVGWGMRLYRTTNGGKVWKWVTALGNNEFTDIAFSSSTAGYVNATSDEDQAAIQRTSDGGKTWSQQIVSSAEVANVSTGTGTDYLLAGTSGLLFTTSGGQTGASSTLQVTTKKDSLPKPKTVTINGTLSPAKANRQVTVHFLEPGETFWDSQVAKTASNGKFSVKVDLGRGTNYIVAQWPGDESLAGAGTQPLVIEVG